MAPTLESIARNAAVDAVAALCDAGDVRFETSADNAVAPCGFAATAFGAGSSGVATAATISDDADAAGGTVEHAILRKSDTSKIMEVTCTATGGGGDIVLTSLVIGAGDTVSISSMKLTQPAS